MWQKLLWIALAGAVGTLARYFLGSAVQRVTGAAFPWSTLVINGLGCYLFGVVFMLAQDRLVISAETRFIVLVGFMGAFTTFSTFAFETASQLNDGQWLRAGANVLLQNGLGIALVFLGFSTVRWWFVWQHR